VEDKDCLISEEDIKEHADRGCLIMFLSSKLINNEILVGKELDRLLKKYNLEETRWLGYHFSLKEDRIDLLREWGIEEKDLEAIKILNSEGF